MSNQKYYKTQRKSGLNYNKQRRGTSMLKCNRNHRNLIALIALLMNNYRNREEIKNINITKEIKLNRC